MKKELLELYLVLGSPNCNRDPRHVLREAIEGGITLFQYREKGTGSLEDSEKLELAKDLLSICREHQIPFIVNDDINLALEIDADGVHIGQEDELATSAREKIGDKILGVSAHNVEEALAAVKAGADYIGVGPMYETSTKTDVREVQGPEVIGLIREAGVTLPLVGIGGISQGKAEAVIKAGANGVAVISAISMAEFPLKSAQGLLGEVRKS
ncbi:thiamine phosphate synthase [Bacillus luteolus]|uniref:Thiamine-phosphate synthase n=1 Tax=Litchfieldia luteola TaxID=682179 RepID=A0ABR9QE70_9BACI|nr:thiamine phosphate synthase [Cytobacillus luteolus]MBE4906792.1 thiamine phosphate synthase [Cytobacillus luteolus]MBP1940554.1 thiamine-phosphate pyrophosphorylase [Cytobacillus luteolus]